MKRSQINRTKGLRRRSKEQAARMKCVKEEYERVFAEPQRCAWCGRFGATSPHHHTEKRRNGDGLFFFVPLHEVPCHQFIHANPKLASERGFLDCDWSDRFKLMVHEPNPLFLDEP